MSGTMSEVYSIASARKPHRCLWCWEAIMVGEAYKRYRMFMCREASTVCLHPECYGAMIETADEEGGWIEWTPGQERPAIANTTPKDTK